MKATEDKAKRKAKAIQEANAKPIGLPVKMELEPFSTEDKVKSLIAIVAFGVAMAILITVAYFISTGGQR